MQKARLSFDTALFRSVAHILFRCVSSILWAGFVSDINTREFQFQFTWSRCFLTAQSPCHDFGRKGGGEDARLDIKFVYWEQWKLFAGLRTISWVLWIPQDLRRAVFGSKGQCTCFVFGAMKIYSLMFLAAAAIDLDSEDSSDCSSALQTKTPPQRPTTPCTYWCAVQTTQPSCENSSSGHQCGWTGEQLGSLSVWLRKKHATDLKHQLRICLFF